MTSRERGGQFGTAQHKQVHSGQRLRHEWIRESYRQIKNNKSAYYQVRLRVAVQRPLSTLSTDTMQIPCLITRLYLLVAGGDRLLARK